MRTAAARLRQMRKRDGICQMARTYVLACVCMCACACVPSSNREMGYPEASGSDSLAMAFGIPMWKEIYYFCPSLFFFFSEKKKRSRGYMFTVKKKGKKCYDFS